MSAHCENCGVDPVYTDKYPAMECPRCTKDARIAGLEALITEIIPFIGHAAFVPEIVQRAEDAVGYGRGRT